MLNSFLFNFCLMITVISLLQYFLRDSKLDLSWNLSRRLAVGLLMGGVGMILIKNSVHFTDTIVIDLRYVVFMVAAYFGGPVVSVTAGVLMLTYRLLFLGVTLNSQVATVSGTLTLLSFNWVTRMKWPFSKTMLGFAVSLIVWIVIGSTILRIWTPNYVVYVIAMITTSLVVGALIINFITYTFEGLKQHRRLAFSHDYDYLTKLHSVRYFDVELNHQFDAARQNRWPMSLLMLDLDHFKHVNDTYGHDVGDIVLKELGILLMTQCRPTDIVARKGGEEFAIILNQCDFAQAKVIAERIRSAVEQMRFAQDKQP